MSATELAEQPALTLHDVAVARGGRVLIERLSLTLPRGGAALVTGPNGAGKSSLLRAVAGLGRASGTLLRPASVALLDERHALDPELPLAVALAFWASGGADVTAALTRLALAPLAEVPVRLLSTGQRRRAAFARVLVTGADLWLLDEPANGLDADARARLDDCVAAHRRGGGVVMAATHQPLDLPGAVEIAL